MQRVRFSSSPAVLIGPYGAQEPTAVWGGDEPILVVHIYSMHHKLIRYCTGIALFALHSSRMPKTHASEITVR